MSVLDIEAQIEQIQAKNRALESSKEKVIFDTDSDSHTRMHTLTDFINARTHTHTFHKHAHTHTHTDWFSFGR